MSVSVSRAKASRSVAVKAKLDYPVIDTDLRTIEYTPLLEDYIAKYRHEFSFHPVHGIMALYPLKRLRHAGRAIIAGAEDPAVPQHCGFGYADSIEAAIDLAKDEHGSEASVALVEYTPAFNRQ
jgi:hypothetical protein